MNYAIIILVSLVFSAFFSGMEIAFVSANRLRIELDKKQGHFSARFITLFLNNPGQYIVTMLIGNNIALVVYGIIMALVLEPWIRLLTQSEGAILVIQTLVSTALILITAEFLPKTLFRIRPNILLNLFAPVVYIFYLLFYPAGILTIALSNFLLRYIFRTRIPRVQGQNIFRKIDLDHLVSEAYPGNNTGPGTDHNIRIFQNALDFAKVKVRECMIPRTEIIALEQDASMAELKKTFIETGLSKILIYKDSIDNVLGYINVREMFRNPKSIRSRLIGLSIVPETMPANKLLEVLMAEKKSIALVVDEFGGTSGLVTIEDILEEIFGEIEDEHDVLQLVDKQVSDREFIFSGRMEIDYINEKYKLGFPETDDYETLAGFILFHHSKIPMLNEIISADRFEFRILKLTHARIELVKLNLVNS